MKLEKYIEITGTITVKTGLHIGGNKDDIEIGGNDNPVMRHPVTKQPYIPGSSLKGKMRSLLELHLPLGLDKICIADSKKLHVHTNEKTEKNCPICNIFGSTSKEEIGPTRIIVRDCYVKTMPENAPISGTEVKYENTIIRTSGKADKPRPIERVVPDTVFTLDIILRRFDIDKALEETCEHELVDYVKEALKLVEIDGLGGSISRGCGKVAIEYETEDLKAEVAAS